MSEALNLATKGLGRTSPNPLVGAVIAKDNRIIGRGFHRKFGEAHAETIALLDAKQKTAGATLYINLEPCCHHGKTPPCVEAVVQAGIKRVVIAMLDPNPAVSGQGVKFLRKYNIEVDVGLAGQQALELNRAYAKYIRSGRPYVIIKIAASLDGKINQPNSSRSNRYITSLASRRMVHAIRGYVDAVLVGVNTILSDNPYLTNRLAPGHDPARIILDTKLRTPLKANALEPKVERIIACSRTVAKKRLLKFHDHGVKVMKTRTKNGMVVLKDLLRHLGRQGITSLMVEGGAKVFSDFLKQGLYDEIILYVAPVIRGKGRSFSDEIDKIVKLNHIKAVALDQDCLFHYVHRNN